MRRRACILVNAWMMSVALGSLVVALVSLLALSQLTLDSQHILVVL